MQEYAIDKGIRGRVTNYTFYDFYSAYSIDTPIWNWR